MGKRKPINPGSLKSLAAIAPQFALPSGVQEMAKFLQSPAMQEHVRLAKSLGGWMTIEITEPEPREDILKVKAPVADETKVKKVRANGKPA